MSENNKKNINDNLKKEDYSGYSLEQLEQLLKIKMSKFQLDEDIESITKEIQKRK